MVKTVTREKYKRKIFVNPYINMDEEKKILEHPLFQKDVFYVKIPGAKYIFSRLDEIDKILAKCEELMNKVKEDVKKKNRVVRVAAMKDHTILEHAINSFKRELPISMEELEEITETGEREEVVTKEEEREEKEKEEKKKLEEIRKKLKEKKEEKEESYEEVMESLVAETS